MKGDRHALYAGGAQPAGEVDRHALYAGGALPAGGESADLGGGREGQERQEVQG